MADYRQIHVAIWKDEWFIDLEPEQKLLFVYLFSNANTSLSGLYKLPMKVIAFETGLEPDYITESLNKFSNDGKVHYENGIVWVVNMTRYHSSWSPKVRANIINDIARIPDCPLKMAYLRANDTVSIGYQYGMGTNPINLKDSKEEESHTVSRRGNGSPPSEGESLQIVAETLTGLMMMPKDVQTLRSWEEIGVIESDIRDALQWRKDSGLPPIKTISQLAGGVKTSHARRVQSDSARKANADYRPEDHATEVYN